MTVFPSALHVQELRDRFREYEHTTYPTPRHCVAQFTHASLYAYSLARATSSLPPVLVVYSLINETSVLDLEPQCSWIERLTHMRRPVYLLEWRTPGPSQLNNSIQTLHEALHWIEQHTHEKTHLLGICQGGVLSYLAACANPHALKSLIFLMTPFDTQSSEETLGLYLKALPSELIPEDEHHCVPAWWILLGFITLKPFPYLWEKYWKLAQSHNLSESQLARFARIEHWVYQTRPQLKTFFEAFKSVVYDHNLLNQKHFWCEDLWIDRSRLKSLPLLNVICRNDGLVPPSSSLSLARDLPHNGYQEWFFETGHLGLFMQESLIEAFHQRLESYLYKIEDHPPCGSFTS